jgi:hypothetical protein
MDGFFFSVTLADNSIASVAFDGDKMIVTGLKAGQTTATITGVSTDSFVITVREKANGNGWL